MNEDNIVPAVSIQQEEMTAAEFQRRLYAWFEDRGLLSDLRAHLRKQMITVLKDSAIGRTVTTQTKQAISPKLQALNLLIAEFLLQQDYHYSLSVFSTEVPLINVLPELPGLTANCYSNNISGNSEVSTKKWQFTEKDAWDILETLGIHRDTDEGQNIFMSYYSDTNKEALLTCIVRMLHTMQFKSRTNLFIAGESNNIKEIPSDTNNNNNNNLESSINNVNEIINADKPNTEKYEEVLKTVQEAVTKEKNRLKQEAKEEYLKLQFTLKLQMAKKDEEQKKKFIQMRKSLEIEKTKWQAARQKEADDFHTKLQHHKNILRDRYQDLISRERDVHEREQQLRQKEVYLDSQQQSLEIGFENLYEEQQNVTQLQDRLNHELREKQRNAQHDAVFLKGLQNECASMKNQIDHTKETINNTANDSKTSLNNKENNTAKEANQERIQDLIKQLQIENINLRNLNSEQQIRIEELSQQAAYLARDLESTRAVVDTSRRLSRSGIVTAPPLTAPPQIARHSFGNSWSGAGEEAYRTSPPASPREHRQVHVSRDTRRRVPPRRLTVHSSGSSNDHSPTNDVLVEARERLRRLEQEGEDVDKQYNRLLKSRPQTDYYSYYRNLHRTMFGSYYNGSLDKRRYSLNLQRSKLGNMPQLYISTNHDDESSGLPNNANVPEHTCNEYYASLKCNHKKQEESSEPHQVIDLHTPFRLKDAETDEESVVQVETLEKIEKDKPADDGQSVASSGILGEMLAAGTSGVSLSGIDTTDEKSDTPVSNQTTEIE